MAIIHTYGGLKLKLSMNHSNPSPSTEHFFWLDSRKWRGVSGQIQLIPLQFRFSPDMNPGVLTKEALVVPSHGVKPILENRTT